MPGMFNGICQLKCGISINRRFISSIDLRLGNQIELKIRTFLFQLGLNLLHFPVETKIDGRSRSRSASTFGGSFTLQERGLSRQYFVVNAHNSYSNSFH